LRRLTTNPAQDRDPVWSPDGSQIAFASSRDNRIFEIFVMDMTTGQIRQITDTDEEKRHPVWSPDGTSIMFNGTVNGESGNFLVNVAAGVESDPIRLPNDAESIIVSDWQS
jgi:Tol biopolymer transport system component